MCLNFETKYSSVVCATLTSMDAVVSRPDTPPYVTFGSGKDFCEFFDCAVLAASGTYKNEINRFVKPLWYDMTLDNDAFKNRVVTICDNFCSTVSDTILENGMNHAIFTEHKVGFEYLLSEKLKEETPEHLHHAFDVVSADNDVDYEYTGQYVKRRLLPKQMDIDYRLYDQMYPAALSVMGPLSNFLKLDSPHAAQQCQDYQADVLETMVDLVNSSQELFATILSVLKERVEAISVFWQQEADQKRIVSTT